MFSSIRISRRLLILISALTLTFVLTGAVTLVSLTDMSHDTAELNLKTAESAAFVKLAGSVRYHLVDVSQQLSSGALTWQEAKQLLETGSREFETLWNRQQAQYAGNPEEEEFFTDAFGIEVAPFRVRRRAISEAKARTLLWVSSSSKSRKRFKALCSCSSVLLAQLPLLSSR